MRNVMIYGIREVGTEHIIYVGATTNLKNRKLTGYGSKIGKRLRKISWEYIVLETVDLARSVATEAHWIGKLRADGHRLLNVSRPGRTKTKEIAPRRSGKNTNPRRQFEIPERAWSLIDKAAENAVESWPEWARGALAIAIAQQLKIDEAEVIAMFDGRR